MKLYYSKYDVQFLILVITAKVELGIGLEPVVSFTCWILHKVDRISPQKRRILKEICTTFL